jgi:hypothetical protein
MLVGDVRAYPIHAFVVDGKCAVAVLPIKVAEGFVLGFHPFGRMRFDFFQQFHEGYFLGQHAQDVDVVCVPADFDGLALQFFANASKVAVEFLLIGRQNKRLAVLGAEDEVYVVFD